MLETCYLIYNQELASAKSLKADLELGINPQLQPGEDASTNAGEFGVQCPFSAFAQFENSGMAWRAEDGAFAAKHPPPGGSWKNVINDGGEDDDYVVGRCRSCFTNFSVAVAPNGDPSEESVKYSTDTYEYAFPTTAQSIANTSSVVDGCNCVGIFPIPFEVCLDELSYLSDGTRFKCSGSNLNFLQDYRAFMRASTDNFNWWKNYIYATESAEESFEKIVMTYVKVQTTLSENENDFKMGLDMLEKWDKWTHDYNAYIDAKVETSSSISSTYSPAKAMVRKSRSVHATTDLLSTILLFSNRDNEQSTQSMHTLGIHSSGAEVESCQHPRTKCRCEHPALSRPRVRRSFVSDLQLYHRMYFRLECRLHCHHNIRLFLRLRLAAWLA